MPLPQGAGPMHQRIREIQAEHGRMLWAVADLQESRRVRGEELAAQYKEAALAGDINGADRIANEFAQLLANCGNC